MQREAVKRIVDRLGRAHKRGKELVDNGGAKGITNIDVDTLYIAREETRSRGLEATFGVRKALAALEEAIGLNCNDPPLDIVDDQLPPWSTTFPSRT